MLYCPHKEGTSKACIERCIYFIDEGDKGGCLLVDDLENKVSSLSLNFDYKQAYLDQLEYARKLVDKLNAYENQPKRVGRPPKLPQGE